MMNSATNGEATMSGWLTEAETEIAVLEAERQRHRKEFTWAGSNRRGFPDGDGIKRTRKLIAGLNGMVARLQKLVSA